MGGVGWGKKQKKFMQGKMPGKKNRAKKKVKIKIHAEVRSNYDFYLIYKICQCLLNYSYSKYSLGLTLGTGILLTIIINTCT